MKQFDKVRDLVSNLPESTVEPHFEKTSFRVKKKIFATYNPAKNWATLKFSEIDQDVFTKIGNGAIYPVPNKWGKQGWTHVELDKLPDELVADAITTAYCTVAPEKLAKLVRPKT
jgi:predicted DNA-binding protein (MmcQ/YjbR family)